MVISKSEEGFMKYKLIASDFDETLFKKSMEISQFSIDTINEYVKAGGRFVICTGRMYASIIQQARKLGLIGDIICFQGALTANIQTGECLARVPLDYKTAIEYCDFMADKVLNMQVYVGNHVYVDTDNELARNYVRYCNVPLMVVDSLETLLKTTNEPIYKVFCNVLPQKNAEIRNLAKQRFGDKLLINSSKFDNVEAVNINTSKGNALEKLCQGYGVSALEVMSFGDNLNDMDLIKFAGLGVAVGNAVTELKQEADYISESCDDDGVAKTIHKFCLEV